LSERVGGGLSQPRISADPDPAHNMAILPDHNHESHGQLGRPTSYALRVYPSDEFSRLDGRCVFRAK
jgi:hypothetical protein